MLAGKFHAFKAGTDKSNGKALLETGFEQRVENGLREALVKVGGWNKAAYQPSHPNFLVALSGGHDSTALVAAMAQICKKRQWSLHVCHVNHQLRSAESKQDEEFCRQLCRDLQVPLLVKLLEPDSAPASEAGWRDARYRLLQQAASEVSASYVVLGHTLDDQAETMLFRWFRGTALRGLTGIPVARRLDQTVFLLRPLLRLSRAQCLDFLRSRELTGQEDSSNSNLDFTRNYIRSRVVPPIVERFADFASKMEQTRQILSAEDDYLAEVAASQLELLQAHGRPNNWPRLEFVKQPLALQRRLIALALQERNVKVTFARVEEILQCCRKPDLFPGISVNALWDLQVSPQYIHWRDKSLDKEVVLNNPQEYAVKIPGLTMALAWQKALKIEACNQGDFNGEFPAGDASEALVDLSAVKLPLVLRTRRAGDIIRPFGRQQTVRLKKYLHNQNVPESICALPGNLMVLCSQEEVLWIPGVGLSDLLRVKQKPTHRLSWLDLKTDVPDIC